MRGRGFFEAGHVSARATRKAVRNTARPRRRWRRFFSGVAWNLIPVVLVLSAAGYTYAALVIHGNPPVVAGQGSALRPTLRSGELVVLVPVHVDAVAKGELIAVRISTSARETYNLPATMIQRVVRIEHTATGRVFITEARRGGLEFTTPASDVVGRPRFVVAQLGYVFRFATSVEGVIFFVALAAIWLLYFIFGVIDERRMRRRASQASAPTMSGAVHELQTTQPDATALGVRHIEGSPPGSILAQVPSNGEALSSDVVAHFDLVGTPEAGNTHESVVKEPRKTKKVRHLDDAKAPKSSKGAKKKGKKRKKND